MMMYISEQKKLLINEILKLGLTKPFHEVRLRLSWWSLGMRIEDAGAPIRSTGLYVIYAKDQYNKNECLYVGESDWCVNQRIRRFFKELTHCSNINEDHAGARRAMEGGYTGDSHSYYIKHITWSEVLEIEHRLNISTDWHELDEQIAYFLRSKYNSSTYKLYGYSGSTLKEFLEVA